MATTTDPSWTRAAAELWLPAIPRTHMILISCVQSHFGAVARLQHDAGGDQPPQGGGRLAGTGPGERDQVFIGDVTARLEQRTQSCLGRVLEVERDWVDRIPGCHT